MLLYVQRCTLLNTQISSPTIATENVTTTESLGMTIDLIRAVTLTDKLTKEVACGIVAIKPIMHLVPQATVHLIGQALIQPHFDSCSVVWRDCGITLQNNAPIKSKLQHPPPVQTTGILPSSVKGEWGI